MWNPHKSYVFHGKRWKIHENPIGFCPCSAHEFSPRTTGRPGPAPSWMAPPGPPPGPPRAPRGWTRRRGECWSPATRGPVPWFFELVGGKKTWLVGGWWFQTWILVSIYYGIILPIDDFRFFSEGWLNHQPDGKPSINGPFSMAIC